MWPISKDSPRLAIKLAQNLKRNDILEKILILPQHWLNDTEINRSGAFFRIRWKKFDPDAALKWNPSWDFMWSQSRDDILDLLKEQDKLSELAAQALYRIGKPELLYKRWSQGPDWRIPDHLIKQIHWPMVLNLLFRGRNNNYSNFTEFPVQAGEKIIEDFRAGKPDLQIGPWPQQKPYKEFETMRRNLKAALKYPNPLAFLDFELVAQQFFNFCDCIRLAREDKLDKLIELVGLTLMIIGLNPPAEIDSSLRSWIEQVVNSDGSKHRQKQFEYSVENLKFSARKTAALKLFELGDYKPIDDWLEWERDLVNKEEDSDESNSGEILKDYDYLKIDKLSEMIFYIETLVKNNPKFIDYAWKKCSLEIRSKIFDMGLGQINGEDLTIDFPRPWVFSEWSRYDRSEQKYTAHRIMNKYPDEKRLTPIIKSLVAKSTGREKAYWSVMLHRLEPWNRDVITAIKFWMEKDTEPFSTPPEFRVTYNRYDKYDKGIYIGGSMVLLDLAKELAENHTKEQKKWMFSGAKRLWYKLLDLENVLNLRTTDQEDRENSSLLDVDFRKYKTANPYESMMDIFDFLGEGEFVYEKPSHFEGSSEKWEKFFEYNLLSRWLRTRSSQELHQNLGGKWTGYIESELCTRAYRANKTDKDLGARIENQLTEKENWYAPEELFSYLCMLSECDSARVISVVSKLMDQHPQNKKNILLAFGKILPLLGEHKQEGQALLRKLLQRIE